MNARCRYYIWEVGVGWIYDMLIIKEKLIKQDNEQSKRR